MKRLGTTGIVLAMMMTSIIGWTAKPRVAVAKSHVSKVDLEATGSRTRVTVFTSELLEASAHPFGAKVPRLIVDINGEWVPLVKGLHQTMAGKGPLVDRLRIGAYRRGVTRLVLYLNDEEIEWKTQSLSKPNRVVIEIRRKDGKGKERAPAISSDTHRAGGKRATRTLVMPPREVPNPKAAQVEPPLRSQSPGVAIAREIGESNVMRGMTPRLDRLAARPEDKPGLRRRMPVTHSEAPVAAKVAPSKPVVKTAPPEEDAVPAKNLADGSKTLTRMLGLKLRRVIIDAGHGGHDVGTTGPTGFTEKELVLDVALRLGDLIRNRLGAEVLQTRSDDSYVGLGERTRFANEHEGDLFISVHANASRDDEAAGVETYYLNFTNSADAIQVASRENATSDRSIGELNDLVKKIALKDKVTESREFAGYVQSSMQSYATKVSGPIPDRGVKKALFVVLIGAKMPSILSEIGFLSNPKEEARMKRPEYRQKIAEALFQGVQKYAGTLSRVQVAKRAGQGSTDE